MSNSPHRPEQSGVYTPPMLPEPIYIAVPHQLPPRVHHGHPPEDSHDLHALHECRTVDDLEALAAASGRGGVQLRHQSAAVAVIARRELRRLGIWGEE
jgi:hypothetical protein